MVKDLNTLPEMQNVLEFDDDLYELVGCQEENIEKLTTAPYSYWKSVWKQLFKNKVVIFCLIIVGILLFFTIFGPMMPSSIKPNLKYPDNPYSGRIYCAPSSEHWFGCAVDGSDLWHAIWRGCQFSLKLAVVVSLINVVIGLIVGGFWGYIKAIDPIMIEISNVISNIPSLLIYVMVLELLPKGPEWGFWNAVIIMTMFGWLGLASTMRNQIIIIRNREFNIASECLGSKASTIIVHNLLPNLVSIIAQVVIDYIPATISSEVSLIFFGVFPVTVASLGKVLNDAYKISNFNIALYKAPYTLIIPSIVMILMTVAFFYFGLALADATDPKRHR